MVKEEKNKKKYPFTGLFGATGSASNLLKNIETRVDLPKQEFKAPVVTKPVVSDE